MIIFVYGSLRRLEANHRRFRADLLIDLFRTGVTKPLYTLRDFGSYPGLYTGGTTAVVGELYEVDEHNPLHVEVLNDLERIERSAGYERQMIVLESDEVVYGWVMNPARDGRSYSGLAPEIASGDWTLHNTPKREARDKAWAEQNARWDAEDAAARVRAKAPRPAKRRR
jgi:gamma-glutamylaminecyclotransferase